MMWIQVAIFVLALLLLGRSDFMPLRAFKWILAAIFTALFSLFGFYAAAWIGDATGWFHVEDYMCTDQRGCCSDQLECEELIEKRKRAREIKEERKRLREQSMTAPKLN